MNMIGIFHSMEITPQELTVAEVLATNRHSQKYGLALTPEDAQEVIAVRNRSVRNSGRVELGIQVIKKIITTFCSSPYININDYTETLNDIIETFYFMKNETEDKIGDNELIDIMKDFFDNSCRGSMELLKNRELPLFAINFRRRIDQAIDSYGKGEPL